ncbi:MAG: large conductance mechanosensitive channel protein MscL [Gemmobacter sp.]|jgi:large conductance mechanosensitive channel|nr:large conductance mechanosensitive channel protein MscL [Gemmobacter sp.]
MLDEFKAFIARGNVLDMAVGIIIGAAFTAIVTSLVDDLINPLIGIVIGGIDFSALSVGLGEARFMYGNFVNAVIKFLIVAWTVFLLVRTVNHAAGLRRKKEAVPAGPTEVELLQQILSELKTRT